MMFPGLWLSSYKFRTSEGSILPISQIITAHASTFNKKWKYQSMTISASGTQLKKKILRKLVCVLANYLKFNLRESNF